MKKSFLFSLLATLLIGLSACESAVESTRSEDGSSADVGSTKENGSGSSTSSNPSTASENSSPDKDVSLDGTSKSKKNSEKRASKGSEDSSTGSKDPKEGPISITSITPPDEIEDTYDFHAYEKLNSFLSTYVTYNGNVNYSSIKANKSELTAITEEFEDNYPASDWTTAQKLTYWINAYNVYTIQLIVDNYPTTSITKITEKPWHKKFIKLGGKTYSLNEIENDVIRKQFNEPRIHFALNCASKSCPVLLNKAYTPDNVYTQMTTQTKRFLQDSSKNKFGDKEIQISQLFDWYKEDFTKNGTVIDFINKYHSSKLSNQKITYLDYSWDLNK